MTGTHLHENVLRLEHIHGAPLFSFSFNLICAATRIFSAEHRLQTHCSLLLARVIPAKSGHSRGLRFVQTKGLGPVQRPISLARASLCGVFHALGKSLLDFLVDVVVLAVLIVIVIIIIIIVIIVIIVIIIVISDSYSHHH